MSAATSTDSSGEGAARLLTAARAIGIAITDEDKPPAPASRAPQSGSGRAASILANLEACGLLPQEAAHA
ncbi:hypothetical protein [Neoroseomonas oryzicola]|uniref:Uncharacterized protein n=1 Tax=Neoroseomonas oryzicola TaxID=535904 RepID=A0A9X9WDH0_9PROT|nr:hypothetical protein [Neoroseomonas oryzicola]MBR0658380.1 hypothetical protein [Neoroseomonas oryzicola]NKE18545.1 hypothetical protein [Neoroseomonas oryzicola]